MSNQEDQATKDYRYQQRASAFLRKGNRCDLCGCYGNQFHEIIFRSTTLNNAEARRLSFQEELCAVLCSRCHDHAHTEAACLKMLVHNVEVYGYNRVLDALNAVQTELKGKLSIWLWEKEDG